MWISEQFVDCTFYPASCQAPTNVWNNVCILRSKTIDSRREEDKENEQVLGYIGLAGRRRE